MADINDPIDWALDSTGDREILATTGARFTTGVEAVKQNVRLAVTLLRGEWFYDLSRGIPMAEILGKRYNQERTVEIYREAILAVQDVTEILKLTVDFTASTRTLVVYFEVLTPFGNTAGVA